MTDEIDSAILGTLAQIPSPAIANGIERLRDGPHDEGFMDGSVLCRFPSLGPMVGYAVTARLRAQGRSVGEPDLRTELWRHTQSQPGPRVVVIEDEDSPPGVGSFWGEVNANVFRSLGCLGVITNGGVRDLPEMRELGFHAFSGVLSVSHAYNRIVEVGGAVSVGGLRVYPGDLLHADEHGVVRIPKTVAEDLADAVKAVEQVERETINFCQSPGFTLEKLVELRGRVRH
jgi:4-hydroxy-4-methyl-2-oxoglutarate aldolase